jgi:hypothetical protein
MALIATPISSYPPMSWTVAMHGHGVSGSNRGDTNRMPQKIWFYVTKAEPLR